MKYPRRQITIVIDFGYDKLNISDDTLLFREDWSARFARMIGPCSKEARGNVGNFSSGNSLNVSEFTKGNLVSNRRYVLKKLQTRSFLMQ